MRRPAIHFQLPAGARVPAGAGDTVPAAGRVPSPSPAPHQTAAPTEADLAAELAEWMADDGFAALYAQVAHNLGGRQ